MRKVLGQMKSFEVASLLDDLGDKRGAFRIREAAKLDNKDVEFSLLAWPWPKEDPIWKYTSHAYGFIPPATANTNANVAIADAGNMGADTTLKNQTIKITLDRLLVRDYPGNDVHHILFDFYGQHQTTGQKQGLHFTQTYRVLEGQGAAITGYPIFIGLKVGLEGVSFKCQTVNVKNEDDEKMLNFMDGDVFKNGLELLNTVNPALPVVTGFATGITKAVLSRNKNVLVQAFDMGLDFSTIKTRAKLKEGSYVVVQAPVPFDWSQWVYSPTNGQIISSGDTNKTIPYNYIVFSISKMQQ